MQAVVCAISREVDIYVALRRASDLAASLGFGDIDRSKIEIAVLELTRNILAHAGAGELQIEQIAHEGRTGIAIEARDRGPGIADIELAMRDGYSTASSLGAGLPGVQRLMDSFEIESTVGAGTRVRAIKWLPGRSAPGVPKGRWP
ncbi:MAG: anti-sigma regulatory factor [Chloroflexota bacterium]|nr:MAG: anti-sigma regulatory factor [Chloroflexota bacterium]